MGSFNAIDLGRQRRWRRKTVLEGPRDPGGDGREGHEEEES
jgi:hypothetical protein